MNFPFRFNQFAYEEYILAFEWYELQSEGLGEKFMKQVEKKLFHISIHPYNYSKRKSNFREAKVEQFPYSIIYEYFKNKEIIHIAAIYHHKRNPKMKYRKM